MVPLRRSFRHIFFLSTIFLACGFVLAGANNNNNDDDDDDDGDDDDDDDDDCDDDER